MKRAEITAAIAHHGNGPLLCLLSGFRSAASQLTLAATLALAHAGALAEEGISTDRPDFVESSDALAAGRFQIEAGLSLERTRQGQLRSRTVSTPTLLRLGLGHDLEARLETNGLMWARESDRATGATTRARGAADVSFGLKWHTADGDEKSGSPSTAWLLHLDVDSGSSAFRGDGIRPSLRFVAEWDLPQGWSMGVMPGVARDSGANGKRIWSGILAVTASHELAAELRGYVEIAGQRLASKANGGSVVTFDTGLTRSLGPDMQIDISLQRGLTRDSPNWTFGVGWSARF